MRTLISAHETGAGSGLVAATLKKPPKKKTPAATATRIARNPITASKRMSLLRPLRQSKVTRERAVRFQHRSNSALAEHPLALLIHDLARLAERKFHRVVIGRVAVGADELVLLGDAADILRDHARSLVLALGLVGRSPDGEAVVLERRARLALAFRGTATEQGFPEGH